MKKIIISILVLICFVSVKAQSPLRINKYLIDSLKGSGYWSLYHDSTHNGSWGLVGGSGGGGGSVNSVTGTANRIAITGTATDPVVNISTLYVGQNTITTIGTITTGVWNGTAIANANLANSTISGISLGSNLANLSNGFGILFASGTSYNGGTARTMLLDTTISGVTSWVRTKKVIDSLAATIGSGTIGGSIAADQIAFGTASNTIGGSSSFKYISADNSIEWGTGDVISGFGGSLAMAGSVARDNNAIMFTTNAIDSSSNTFMGGGQNTVIYESANGSVSLATDGTIRRSAAYALIANDANEAWGESSSTFGFGNDNFVRNGFLAGNSNVLGALSPGNGNSRSNLYDDSWMIGTSNTSTGSYNGTLGYSMKNTGVKSFILGSSIVFGWTDAIGLGTLSDSASVIIKPASGSSGSYGETIVRGAFRLPNNTSNYNTTMVMLVMDSTSGLTYHQTIPTGGGTTWNGITDPTGDQALTFGAGESSTWTDQNTTEDLFTVNNATSTTSSLLSLNKTGTAATTGGNVAEFISSGANASTAQTATGVVISVTNTNATSGTNIGLQVTASGATTANYAALFTGRVGIGQTIPQTLLHVGGGSTATGFGTAAQLTVSNSGSASYLNVFGPSSSETFIGAESGKGVFGMLSNDAMEFRTNNTTRVRITSGGLTFFGGTTDATARVQIAAGTATANTAPLKLTTASAALLTVPVAGAIEVLVDSIYYTGNDANRYQLTKSLYGSATLDFGSTAAGTVSDLTFAIPGAAVGDVVSIGVDNAAMPAAGTFFAWVSASNTITVRFANNALVTAYDPSSATYKVRVTK